MKTQQAKDLLFVLIQKVATQNSVSKVIWDDLDDKVPAGQVSWARVTMRHADGGQSSLSNLNGVRRFTLTGTIFIQIFTPKNTAARQADTISDSFLDALRKFRDDNLWLRDIRKREVGRDGDFYAVTVLSTFSYDDIG